MENNEKIKVSVLIPCYNHERFIGEAIDSVLNQTYKDFELIVLDNGSTDNSFEIIKSYGNRIKRLQLDKNSWESWDKMLSVAEGEYIAILFSDDYWYPEKLEKQMKAVEENKSCDIFFTWVERVDATLENVIDNKLMAVTNRNRMEWLELMFYESTKFDASSMLIRNNGKFQKYQKIQKKFWQLTDLFMYMNMVMNEEVYVVEEYLIKHRMHGDNISEPNRETIHRTLNELVYIKRWLFNHISDEDFIAAFGNSLLLEQLDKENKADIKCQKILLYLNLGEKNLCYSADALAYYWEHYDDEGVAELLEKKYHYGVEEIRKYSAKYGVPAWQQKEKISDEEKQMLCTIHVMLKKLIFAGRELHNEELLQTIAEVLKHLVKTVLNKSNMPSSSLLVEKCLFVKEHGMSEGEWGEFIDLLENANVEIMNLLT